MRINAANEKAENAFPSPYSGCPHSCAIIFPVISEANITNMNIRQRRKNMATFSVGN